MKQEVTLEQYLRLGGKLEKVNWSDAYCDYGDHNSVQREIIDKIKNLFN